MKSEKEILDFIASEEGSFLKSWIDKQRTTAIKSYSENHPVVDTSAEVEELKDQLAEAREQNEKLKIEAFKKDEAERLGVPRALLAGLKLEFDSFESVTTQLELLKENLDRHVVDGINVRLKRESYVPGSGTSDEGDNPMLDKLDFERALLLEESGKLDDLIKA